MAKVIHAKKNRMRVQQPEISGTFIRMLDKVSELTADLRIAEDQSGGGPNDVKAIKKLTNELHKAESVICDYVAGLEKQLFDMTKGCLPEATIHDLEAHYIDFRLRNKTIGETERYGDQANFLLHVVGAYNEAETGTVYNFLYLHCPLFQKKFCPPKG